MYIELTQYLKDLKVQLNSDLETQKLLGGLLNLIQILEKRVSFLEQQAISEGWFK